ncbi:MAG: hypothetical protein RLZZ628_2695 [Bacteroidota bacterium]
MLYTIVLLFIGSYFSLDVELRILVRILAKNFPLALAGAFLIVFIEKKSMNP